MQTFKQKQCENLEFTAKLTEKNTKLQSENFVLSEKVSKEFFFRVASFFLVINIYYVMARLLLRFLNIYLSCLI